MVLPILAIAFRNFFIDSSGDVKAQQINLLIPLHPRMTSSGAPPSAKIFFIFDVCV
jgi:hypothetical protein